MTKEMIKEIVSALIASLVAVLTLYLIYTRIFLVMPTPTLINEDHKYFR